MNSNTCEVRILVRGKPVTEFVHEGETFMEGRGGSEFEIEVRNKTGNRTMAVISVDGLSIIDGATAGSESPGYAVGPYQTIKIPGWKLATDKAAKFTFGSKSNSYVQATSGSSANCGVIGVMIWSEKQIVKPVQTPWDYIKNVNTGYYGPGIAGAAGAVDNSSLRSTYRSSTVEPSRGITATSASNSVDASSLGDATGIISKGVTAQTARVNNLGTEFGVATTFNTTVTSFDKDSVVDTIVLYYDDARGLKSRGIVIERPVQSRVSPTPNPFPAMSCTPPKGWTDNS